MNKKFFPGGWNLFHLKDITYESRDRAARSEATHLTVFGVNNQTGLNTNSKYHAENLDRYKVVKPGMFAYNPMRLNIGSIGYCNEHLGKGLVSPDYVVFGCKKAELDPNYFYYHVQEHQWKKWVQRAGAGSVRIRIYYEDIGNYKIILPPLPEQRKIAEILSTWDEAIAQTERLLASLRERKKGLMQRLLTGQVRFRGFGGEWSQYKLKQLAQLINGRAFKPEDWKDEGTPIIRIQNLNGSPDFNCYDQPVDERYYVLENDLLFAWSGSRGTSFGPFMWKGPKAILNQHIFKIKVNGSIEKEYLYLFLKQITSQIEQRAHGSAGLVHITKNELEKFDVYLPPSEEERAKIVGVLMLAEKEIGLKQALLLTLVQQKKGLMQRLLTGQVRVRV